MIDGLTGLRHKDALFRGNALGAMAFLHANVNGGLLPNSRADFGGMQEGGGRRAAPAENVAARHQAGLRWQGTR